MSKRYVHLKSGKTYTATEAGLKFFGFWFYLFIYENDSTDMIFIRTRRNFLKKFKELNQGSKDE